jgi:hypothetical protein
MKPIDVSVQVEQSREEVFAFLDVMANHELFTDHMLVDWSYSGPASGIGAKARMRANLPGPKDFSDMTVVDGEAPSRIVEQAVSAKGKRRTQGTYTLHELPGGGTEIRFELRYLEMPAIDKLLSPLLRAWLAKANARAMERLEETLTLAARGGG